jgi:hypothetical protein
MAIIQFLEYLHEHEASRDIAEDLAELLAMRRAAAGRVRAPLRTEPRSVAS